MSLLPTEGHRNKDQLEKTKLMDVTLSSDSSDWARRYVIDMLTVSCSEVRRYDRALASFPRFTTPPQHGSTLIKFAASRIVCIPRRLTDKNNSLATWWVLETPNAWTWFKASSRTTRRKIRRPRTGAASVVPRVARRYGRVTRVVGVRWGLSPTAPWARRDQRPPIRHLATKIPSTTSASCVSKSPGSLSR